MDEATKIYEEALKKIRDDKNNLTEAFHLLESSYSLGNPNAAYALGTWYLHGKHVQKDIKKAIFLFEFAANRDIADACYDLALAYEKGIGVEKGLRDAFKLYLRAALNGDKQSVYEVGRCYYFGIGIDKDEEIADIWLERAEKLGIKD